MLDPDLYPQDNHKSAGSSGKQENLRDFLGDDLWRLILSQLDLDSWLGLGNTSKAFRDLVRGKMMESWNKWNIWKNQVPLYPPEVSGYSTAAKAIDKLLFEKLLCLMGPQTVVIGSFEKESRRHVISLMSAREFSDVSVADHVPFRSC